MCVQEVSSAELVIKNRLGLHARAAAKLVKAASEYESEIRLVKDGEAADARSVLSLISLGCSYDTTVVIEAEGQDAPHAINALKDIIENRFGEE
ncbi:HPr family phosphocarrier protein [Deltaproteobacteria bacterium Smac51]|nr:HPr family phosphocarrier protein [Deltaproteobacteria bacterium Smac51]